jgi:hypothetical protein
VSNAAISARGILSAVMPALVAGIHVFGIAPDKTWMAGTSPAMTRPGLAGHDEVGDYSKLWAGTGAGPGAGAAAGAASGACSGTLATCWFGPGATVLERGVRRA